VLFTAGAVSPPLQAVFILLRLTTDALQSLRLTIHWIKTPSCSGNWPKEKENKRGDHLQNNKSSHSTNKKTTLARFRQVVRAQSSSFQVPLPLQTLKKRNPSEKNLCCAPFLESIKTRVAFFFVLYQDCCLVNASFSYFLFTFAKET
jgi:hypothetical protein